VTGEIHGFSGSEQQAKCLIEMGFYLGFGLQITNQQSKRSREIVKNLPINQYM
jgi:TatD DNase family protein